MTNTTVVTLAVIGSGFAAGLLGATAASAQANPKMDKCLVEAQAKGLYTPNRGDRGSATAFKANVAMAPQRNAFMKECMKRP
ncbi:hypothetical protein SAMN05444161_8640 [Rhizobiales bacterium GAS191]|nr:hypothetical protein SAMN05444161_8640 [Rhizobiales bacterium GAS191]